MKAKKCILIANNAWGYVYKPQRFDSISEAKKEALFLIENGYAHSYRIKVLNN